MRASTQLGVSERMVVAPNRKSLTISSASTPRDALQIDPNHLPIYQVTTTPQIAAMKTTRIPFPKSDGNIL